MTALVRAARRVEETRSLDVLDRVLRPLGDALVADRRRRELLQRQWLSHAVHPLMTDFPLGMWMSGTLLDLVSGPQSRPAARRLIGMGVLAALPTAATGLAEWAAVDGRPERRVGVVHALVNTTALGCYAASWLARRRGRELRGTALALAGGSVAVVGGFFGGHLTEVRKVSTRHPAFDAPGPANGTANSTA